MNPFTEPDVPLLSSSDSQADKAMEISIHLPTGSEPVLCHYCGRTATNGIRCRGMCVADSDY